MHSHNSIPLLAFLDPKEQRKCHDWPEEERTRDAGGRIRKGMMRDVGTA
jgi:hypothetical protein